MSLEPTIVADALVNFFGAAGAYALARETRRADPFGPVSRRIGFALYFVAVLFLLRAFAWSTGDDLAFRAADMVAIGTPLVSLIVAEGLMRRHAPAWMKLALIAGPFLLFLAKVLPFVPASTALAVLITGVFGGYLLVAGFLWRRETDSLTLAENSSIRRVLLALLLLAPMILTDFSAIWPDVPVRLGAVGALLLLYLSFGVGNLQATALSRVITIGVFASVALIFAAGYSATGGTGGTAQIVRVAVVGFSGLLLAAIVSESRGASSERNRAGVSLLGAATPEAFETGLRDHALLGGARLLSGMDLAHVRHPTFDALLAENSVLRRSNAPWGRLPTDDGVERVLSLMTAYDATDLAVLTRAPLRLMLFSLPMVSRDAKSENDIQLVRLVGELAFLKAERA